MPLWYSELTRHQRDLFDATLRTTHDAHTYCELWFRDRSLATTFDDKAFPIDGQVDVQGQSRTATCSVYGPTLKLDTNLIFLDRILRVERWVLVTGLDEYVRVPMFTGPVVKADENGDVISIEAHGFDMWLSGDQKAVYRWKKGSNTVDVIRHLLFLGGLAPKYQSIPDGPWRLPSTYQIGPNPETYDGGIWAAVTELAQSINCDIFFDGAGMCVLQHRPSQITHLFLGGDSGTVIGPPQRSLLLGGQGTDASALVNDCIVFGQAKPKKPPKNPPDGWKPPKLPVIRGEAIARAGSRFAPGSLGFPDTPFYAKDVVTIDSVRLTHTAQAIAKTRLARRTSVAEQVSFDAVLVPYLNPYDRIRVDVEGYFQGTVYLTNFSMPFNSTSGGPMTVGYNARVHVAPPRHRP